MAKLRYSNQIQLLRLFVPCRFTIHRAPFTVHRSPFTHTRRLVPSSPRRSSALFHSPLTVHSVDRSARARLSHLSLSPMMLKIEVDQPIEAIRIEFTLLEMVRKHFETQAKFFDGIHTNATPCLSPYTLQRGTEKGLN